MPYESVPLILRNKEGKIVDIIWPQSSDIADAISLLDMVRTNNLPPYIAITLLEIMIAEQALSTDGVRKVRQYLPDYVEKLVGMTASLSTTPKTASQSAAKVKSNTLDDYDADTRDSILTHALGLQFERASRKNALRITNRESEIKKQFVPIYQILGYTSLEAAKKDFLAKKIDTKGELGVAIATAIVHHYSLLVEEKFTKIDIVKQPDGSIKAKYSLEDYMRDIHPVIEQAGWYEKLRKIDNRWREISIEIAQLQASLKKKMTQKARKDANIRIKELRAEHKWILPKRKAITSAHYTVFRDDINKAWALIAWLNHVWALWPTNIPRALGMYQKNAYLGTYDQYAINILNLNAAWEENKVAQYISIDGDAGPVAKAQASEYGILDPNKRWGIYQEAQDTFLSRVVSWKWQFESAVDSQNDAQVAPKLLNMMTASFEHKYITMMTLKDYIEKLQQDGDKSDHLVAAQNELTDAWDSYVGKTMNPTKLAGIMATLSQPSLFAKKMKLNKSQTKDFYGSRFFPWLTGAMIVMMNSEVAMVDISKQGTWTTNATHTGFRGGRGVALGDSDKKDTTSLTQRQAPRRWWAENWSRLSLVQDVEVKRQGS